MASAVSITESELMEALAAATRGSQPDDARTMLELRAISGVSEKRVRATLVELNAAGRLRVHRVRRTALDGRSAIVPAYTILPPAPV